MSGLYLPYRTPPQGRESLEDQEGNFLRERQMGSGWSWLSLPPSPTPVPSLDLTSATLEGLFHFTHEPLLQSPAPSLPALSHVFLFSPEEVS